MQDLTQISDEALLERSQHGEYAASAELIVRYTPVVLYYAERYCYLGLEKEDLMQEGMIALLSAIRTYRGDRGAAFRTYASRRISNGLAKGISRWPSPLRWMRRGMYRRPVRTNPRRS